MQENEKKWHENIIDCETKLSFLLSESEWSHREYHLTILRVALAVEHVGPED